MKKGFTLVELLVVIAILGILMAMMVPATGIILNRASKARAKADGSGRKVMCLWPGEGFKDLNDELRGVRM